MEFIFFIAICIGIGMFAKSKGRSPWGWGIASAFISPILAGIILALMKDLSQEEHVAQVDMEQQKLQERIAINEVQNNKRFQKVEQQLTSIKKEVGIIDDKSQSTKLIETDTKVCPQCGETIKSSAIKCRYCGADIVVSKMIECPYCKEFIRADAVKCKFCRSELNGTIVSDSGTEMPKEVEKDEKF